MKMLSVVLALALGLMAWSSPVSAQLMNASAAVSALKVGEQVRVQAPGTAVELGTVSEVDQSTVSEVDQSTLYVLESGQEWLIDIGTIERLEVRSRPVVKYALIFGVVGGLAGFWCQPGPRKHVSHPVPPRRHRCGCGLRIHTVAVAGHIPEVAVPQPGSRSLTRDCQGARGRRATREDLDSFQFPRKLEGDPGGISGPVKEDPSAEGRGDSAGSAGAGRS